MSATTITPRQQSFIRSLLEERLDVLEITNLDEYIVSVGLNALTANSASKLIEHLKSVPVGKKSEHAHLPEGRVIVNKFAKECTLCGGLVDSGAGHAVQTANGWRTFHAMDKCSAPADAPRITVESKRAYRCDDGTVAIAYTTQNGRIAMRRLVIHEDNKGSLEYWKGGVAIVSATGSLLTQEQASELGKVYGFCICCGKDLSEDQSLAVGYGRTCAGNNEWWYPSPSEAREILNRPVSI
jgi:hypothetical protein